MRPSALPDKPSLAVLPFTNMSGDPEQKFVSDGIAEDVISALSHYPSLFVIARNSTSTYKGRAVDVKQVGRERMCNLILHRENIGQIAVVAVGPDVIPCFSFYELGSNADPIAGLTHAAF